MVPENSSSRRVERRSPDEKLLRGRPLRHQRKPQNDKRNMVVEVSNNTQSNIGHDYIYPREQSPKVRVGPKVREQETPSPESPSDHDDHH